MTIKQIVRPKEKTLPSWYTPITDKLLRNITARIVAAVRPEKIILFGSYAYGQPTIHSDLDLLVITNAMANQSVFQRHRAVSKLFSERRFGMDVMVRTPKEVKERLARGDDFMRTILERGRILYERRQRRRVDSRSRNGLRKRARSRATA